MENLCFTSPVTGILYYFKKSQNAHTYIPPFLTKGKDFLLNTLKIDQKNYIESFESRTSTASMVFFAGISIFNLLM